MKSVARGVFVISLSILLCASAAYAEKRVYVVDPAHSQINFVAEALLISAHGYFGKWEADINYDADAQENSTLVITIDAASINTRIERRDNHLRSAARAQTARLVRAHGLAEEADSPQRRRDRRDRQRISLRSEHLSGDHFAPSGH